MTNTRRFLALAASASFLFAACSSGGATTAPSAAPSEAAPSEAAPSARRRAPPRPRPRPPPRSGSSSSGRRRPSSPATSPPSSRATTTADGINLTIVPGGPDVIPQAAGSAADGPEFTISWVPKVLEARIGNPASDLVDIAQVFQRSGTLSVSWKDSNITKPADFKGKKIGVWDFGNEFEVTAGALKAGLDPGHRLREGHPAVRHDAPALEADRRGRGDDLQRVRPAARGQEPRDRRARPADRRSTSSTGTTRARRCSRTRSSPAPRGCRRPGNEDVAVRFLKASFQGWIYCRANPADCVQYTLKNGSTLGAGHQAWQLNEVNALIWPSPNGIGIMDPALWQQTVDVSLGAGIIKEAPPADAYRTDLAQKALAEITDDTKGTDFQKGVVEVTEGGN